MSLMMLAMPATAGFVLSPTGITKLEKSFALLSTRVYTSELAEVYDTLLRNDPNFKENVVLAQIRAHHDSSEEGEGKKPESALGTNELWEKIESDIAHHPTPLFVRGQSCPESRLSPADDPHLLRAS